MTNVAVHGLPQKNSRQKEKGHRLGAYSFHDLWWIITCTVGAAPASSPAVMASSAAAAPTAWTASLRHFGNGRFVQRSNRTSVAVSCSSLRSSLALQHKSVAGLSDGRAWSALCYIFDTRKVHASSISRMKGDFANESFRAPVKARFAFQLANHSFNDSRAEALTRGHLHCWAAHLPPAKS